MTIIQTLKKICELQPQYSSSNTQAMQERGLLIRDSLANELREIAFPAVATGSCPAQQYCINAPTTLPAPSTAYAISNGSTFGFYNGTSSNSLSVSLTGTTVYLNSSALLKNVTALSLNFYDSNLSNAAPTVVNLLYVVINVTVEPLGVPPYSLRTRVALRNS